MIEGITDRTPIKIDTIPVKWPVKMILYLKTFYTPDREKLHSQGLPCYRVPLRGGRLSAYELNANCLRVYQTKSYLSSIILSDYIRGVGCVINM